MKIRRNSLHHGSEMCGWNNRKNDITLFCQKLQIIGWRNVIMKHMAAVFSFFQNMLYDLFVPGVEDDFGLGSQNIGDR